MKVISLEEKRRLCRLFNAAAANWKAFDWAVNLICKTLGVDGRASCELVDAILDAATGGKSTAGEWIKESGFRVVDQPRRRGRRPKYSAETIVLLASEGLTHREIAARVGCTHGTVGHILAGRSRSEITGIARVAAPSPPG